VVQPNPGAPLGPKYPVMGEKGIAINIAVPKYFKNCYYPAVSAVDPNPYGLIDWKRRTAGSLSDVSY
jgi:hypothetical protein